MAFPSLDSPIAYPPPGITPNFANPPNHAILAYTVVVSCTVLSTFFAWFRFIGKLCLIKTAHVEDYLIPLAWLATMGYVTLGFLIYDFAPIIHSWDIRLATFGRFLLYFRLSALFYNITALVLKVSVLLQVRRVFVPRGTQPKTSYFVDFLTSINVIHYITTIVLMMCNCRPLSKAWEPWIPGKCIDMGIIAMSTASVNLLSDLAILALTQKVIWNVVRIDATQRLRLSIIFGASIVPCGFAALCLVYNQRMMHSTDFVFDAAIMSLACYGEITSGFFVLFLPVVPRVFSHTRNCLKKSKRGSSRLDFADVGVEENGEVSDGKYDKSLWHISYTQKGGLDGKGEAVWTVDHAVVQTEYRQDSGSESDSLSTSL